MKPSIERGLSPRFSAGAAVAALVFMAATPAFANTVTYTGTSVIFEGSTTGSNGPLGARATFTSGTGGVLKLLLENTSPPASQAPEDLLTSFYFNVLSGTTTGTSAPLTYQSALGQVYVTLQDFPDFTAKWEPPPPAGGTVTYPAPPELSNLQAFNTGDRTWQFRDGLSLMASTPPLAFGVGTVGNSSLSPNNFNGNVVDGFDFGIFVGEVSTQPLDGSLLVKDSIHFEFAGFGGFSLAQISPHGVFGFGTDPDSIITVPEPAGLTALLGACAAWLGWRGRRRVRAVVATSGGLWSACLVAAVAVALLAALPQAKAVPIVENEFDFALGPLGWTTQPVGKLGLTPPATDGKRWTHVNGQWEVNWSPVSGPLVATGNYLTSPLIDPAGPLEGLPVDAFRISFAHKFNFSSSLTVPPAAGQVVYSINGGPYTPLPVAAWSTGNVNTPEPLFGPNPLWPTYVGQTELVVPGYTPPTGSYSDLFPLVNGGASFTGLTPGYSATGGTYVPSVAVLDIPLQLITDFRVRLINANLGSNCPADAGWDVRYLQVDFAAPEPGSLVLAAFGIAGMVSWRLVKTRQGGRRTLEEPGLPQPRDETFAAPEPALQ